MVGFGLIPWSERQLDSERDGRKFPDSQRYSSAFAYGLLEAGFKPGDKLCLWMDATNSAETATAQIGAIKAGLTVVTVDENDSPDDVASALRSSKS